MYFFYTEYINVTFDTQYTFKSILETILFYITLIRSSCAIEEKNVTLSFYVKH